MRVVAIVRDLARLRFMDAAARLYAVLWVIFKFNKIGKKRKIIQRLRKVKDKELLKFFSEKYLLKR
jgi:hypothetical protein